MSATAGRPARAARAALRRVGRPARWSSRTSSSSLIRRSAATTARRRASVGCAVSTRCTRSAASSSARWPGPAVVSDLGHRGGERFPHRHLPGIALPQDADALVLLGQVGQVKVDGEGAGDLLGLVQTPGRDQRSDLVTAGGTTVQPGASSSRSPGGPRSRRAAAAPRRPAARAGGVADDLAEDVAEQPDIASHRLRQRGAVPLSFPVHGQSLIARADLPTSLIP